MVEIKKCIKKLSIYFKFLLSRIFSLFINKKFFLIFNLGKNLLNILRLLYNILAMLNIFNIFNKFFILYKSLIFELEAFIIPS